MTAIAPGQYKAKAVKGSAQFGETEKGNLQIAIDLDVKNDKGEPLGTMTTFLYFTDTSAVYSWERLGLLGWKGKGPDDIDKMDGIETNEVDVRVTMAESYKAEDGKMKMGTSKIEIMTGAGKVTLGKTIDTTVFKNRLKMLSGDKPSGGGGGAPSSGQIEPPF